MDKSENKVIFIFTIILKQAISNDK